MGVDPRQVHGIRILRRDLSLKIKTPKSCTQYHRDKSDLSSGGKNREAVKIPEKENDLNLFGHNILNPVSAFPVACYGVSEHKNNKKRIEDSSSLAARSFNTLSLISREIGDNRRFNKYY